MTVYAVCLSTLLLVEEDQCGSAADYFRERVWISCDPDERTIPALAERFGVLRVKGFAAVANKPLRLLVQAVGARVSHQFDRPCNSSEQRQGRLVVIGLKGLDRAAITDALRA